MKVKKVRDGKKGISDGSTSEFPNRASKKSKLKKKNLKRLNEPKKGKGALKDKVHVKEKTTPKIRRQAATENVEENFIIVPWASKLEWETVCFQFHDGNHSEVIAKIGIWQKRVPTLPVGVEATLFLLEAVVYDQKYLKSQCNENKGIYNEDQARSLYSLAIIRYLNHVSHLATHSLGESSTRLTKDLAFIVDTPEWLVSLRNDVSHGPSAPSIEVLRMGGNFVLQWLKEKYWKTSVVANAESSTKVDDPFTITGQRDSNDAHYEITQLLAAYIAARIYKMRGLGSIKDLEIIRHIHNNLLSPVKTKVAVIALRDKLSSYLFSHPVLFCEVLSQELIPSSEFYLEFASIIHVEESVNKDEAMFDKLFSIWLPILKKLESKGKLTTVISNLCLIIINSEYEKLWMMASRWIDKLLELIECSGKKYAKHLVKILEVTIKQPNPCMKLFVDRLFRLTEPRLGEEKIHQLKLLTSIWIDDRFETKKRRKHSLKELFSLNDIDQGQCDNRPDAHTLPNVNTSPIKWSLDNRSEEFWSNIPIGTLL